MSGAGGELSDHDSQRLGAVELVVAVAGEDERGNGLDASSDQPEDVERGLVRSVDILDNQHRRAVALELANEPGHDLVRPGALPRSPSPQVAADGSAISAKGPSGRGVKSGSHAPQSTLRPTSSCAQKQRKSAVLPTPASPPTKTT